MVHTQVFILIMMGDTRKWFITGVYSHNDGRPEEVVHRQVFILIMMGDTRKWFIDRCLFS